MSTLATLKTLGGATILRALETYKLLFMRFWWLVGILAIWPYYATVSSSSRNYPKFIEHIYLYLPHKVAALYSLDVLTVSMLILLIVLLSRSSMVCKDWHYVFMSAQTIHGITWECLTIFLGALLLSLLLGFSLALGKFIFWILFIPLTIPLILWGYCLLDMNLVWWRYPVILVQSFYQALRLLYHNYLGFLALIVATWATMSISFCIAAAWGKLFSFLFNNPLYSSIHTFMLPYFFITILLIFPWFLGFIAVLYEHMRYRVEGL